MSAERPSIDALLAAASAYPTPVEAAWSDWQHNLTNLNRQAPTYWEAFQAGFEAAQATQGSRIEDANA